MKCLRTLILLTLVLPGTLCGQPQGSTAAGDEKTARISDASMNNRFALKIYNELRSGEGNLCFSPASLRIALAMTGWGAREETASRITALLGLDVNDAPSQAHLSALYGAIAKGASASGKNRLLLANSLWGRQGVSFLPAFASALDSCYGAAVREADFAGDRAGALRAINSWVAEKTDSAIDELLEERDLNGDILLVLVNAILFDGTWAVRFDPTQTQVRSFFVGFDGEGQERFVDVPTMFKRERVGYHLDREAATVEIPYDGNRLSMVIIAPRKRDGLAAFEASLTPETLASRIAGMRQEELALFLPKFEVRSSNRLRGVLTALGMGDAFDPKRADFSGITGTTRLWIDNVIHEAVVAVDEAGTRATAATAVTMTKGGGGSVRTDRPFLFLIRDRTSGAILFMGRVTDPTHGCD